MPSVLKLPKFRIWQSSERGRVLSMQALRSVLNIYLVLNMPEVSIWLGCENARVTQHFKCATI